MILIEGLKRRVKQNSEQAYTQGQAHLQFAQNPPENQKLQKSLPFSNRTWRHCATLKHLIIRRLKNKTQLLTSGHTPLGV